MSKSTITTTGGISVEIISDRDLQLGKRDDMFINAILPGAFFDSGKRESIFKIIHQESPSQTMNAEGENINISSVRNGKIPIEIYRLMYSLIQHEQLKKSLFNIHASCVSGENGACLLVGHSFSGKSTTALSLIKNYGMKLLSGDKTTVSFGDKSISLEAGTSTVTLLRKDEVFFSDLIVEKIYYANRLAFSLGEDQYGVKKQDIKMIFLLNPSNNQIQLQQLTEKEALKVLYPYFLDKFNSDFVSGELMNILVKDVPIEVNKFLFESLKKSLSNVPVYSIEGSLAGMSKVISDIESQKLIME